MTVGPDRTPALRRDEIEAAHAATELLQSRFPDNAVVENLDGVVLRAVGDGAGARQAFERALAIDPEFQTAAYNFADLALAEGDLSAARRYYQHVLYCDPRANARSRSGIRP